MPHTISKIAGLIRHHLVLSKPSRDRASATLDLLVSDIKLLVTTPSLHEALQEAIWFSCDKCATSVNTDLTGPDAHLFSYDGHFYCPTCWEGEGEML